MRAVLRLAWLGIVTCCCGVLRAGDETNTFDSRLQRAETQFQAGNYAAAYRLADAAARASKDGRPSARAVQLLATICFRSGRYPEALKHGEQFLRLVDRPGVGKISSVHASRQEMALMLAEVNGSLGRHRSAGNWFEYALRIPDGKRLANPIWESEVRLRWATMIPKAESTTRGLALYREAADGAQRVLRQIERREVAAKHRPKATEVFAEACLATARLRDAEQVLETLLSTQHDPRQRFETLSRLADVCHQAQATEREAEILERALAEQKLDEALPSPLQAQLLERLASAREQQAQRNPEKADSLLQHAQRGWQEAAECYEALSKSDRDDDRAAVEVISDLQHLQEIYVRLSQWQEARDAAEKLAQARKETLLSNDPSIFRAKTALGICYFKCEQFQEAKEQLEAALEFWQDYEPRACKELADTHQNLAELARQDGKFGVAKQHLEEVLRLLEALPPDEIRFIECHITLANVLSAQAEYTQADSEYRTAVEACKRDDERVQRLRGLALLGCATIYKTQLKFDPAIEACKQALDVYRGLATIHRADQIPCLTTLAALHLSGYELKAARGPLESQDLDAARDYIVEADQLSGNRGDLPIDQQCQILHVQGLISFREAQSRCRLGPDRDLAAASKSCAKAIEHWQQAATLAETKQRRAVRARSLSYLAEAQLLDFQIQQIVLKDPPAPATPLLDQAYENSSKAIDLVGQLQAYPGLHYRALLTRAKILRGQAQQPPAAQAGGADQAKIDKAIADLQKAVRVIEAPRSASLGPDPERAEFFSQFVEAYELLITWLVEQERYNEAVAYSQISRNRTFIEQVTVSKSNLLAELAQNGHGALLDQLLESRERCDQLRKQVQADDSKALSSQVEREQHEKLITSLDSAQAECEHVESEVRAATRTYRNLLQGELSVADWDQARQQIVGDDGLLLIYHVGPAASQLFTVTPKDDVSCYRLKVSKEAAEALHIPGGPLSSASAASLVNRYLGRHEVRGTRSASAPPSSDIIINQPLLPAESVQLAKIVLPEEVRDLIHEKRPAVVTVVPDGALHQLPLESLLLQDKPELYLLNDEQIPPLAYAPSALVLAALQSRGPAFAHGPPSLLTVGKRDYAEYGKLYSSLPSALNECGHWAKLFATRGSDNVRTLLGDRATVDDVRSAIKGTNFVHFAVHGMVDPKVDNDTAASLVLTPQPPRDDGRLYLKEIFDLPLGACELAVLSACESNVGPSRKLEAGASMTRAFLSAGARRVVASLWRVDDASTAQLMDEFADAIDESLKKNARPDYAKSLQRARLRVQQNKNPDWSEPRHWAPFILVGPAN